MDELKTFGWCAPSEALLDVYNIPNTPVPPACTGPHRWEKFSVADSACDCGLCGSERRYWLECADCYESWYEDGTDLFAEVLNAAQWG